jgi:hypothetical protein
MKDKQLNYVLFGLLVLVVFVILGCQCTESFGSGYPHAQINDEIKMEIQATTQSPNVQLGNQNDTNPHLGNVPALIEGASSMFHRSEMASQQLTMSPPTIPQAEQVTEGFGSDWFHRSEISGNKDNNAFGATRGYPNAECTNLGNTCAYGQNFQQSAESHNDVNIQSNIIEQFSGGNVGSSLDEAFAPPSVESSSESKDGVGSKAMTYNPNVF